jgi:hypothetical protein
MNFDTLPDDLIIKIALSMDLGEISSLCQTSVKFNQVVCENKQYWMNKMIRDYGLYYNDYKTLINDSRTLYYSLINNPKKVYELAINSDLNKLIGAAVYSMYIKDKRQADLGKTSVSYLIYEDHYLYESWGVYNEYLHLMYQDYPKLSAMEIQIDNMNIGDTIILKTPSNDPYQDTDITVIVKTFL